MTDDGCRNRSEGWRSHARARKSRSDPAFSYIGRPAVADGSDGDPDAAVSDPYEPDQRAAPDLHGHHRRLCSHDDHDQRRFGYFRRWRVGTHRSCGCQAGHHGVSARAGHSDRGAHRRADRHHQRIPDRWPQDHARDRHAGHHECGARVGILDQRRSRRRDRSAAGLSSARTVVHRPHTHARHHHGGGVCDLLLPAQPYLAGQIYLRHRRQQGDGAAVRRSSEPMLSSCSTCWGA